MEIRFEPLATLRRHGWNATSFQTLGPGLRYFTDPLGYVAYVDTGRAWVAAGAPVAPVDHLAQVGERFLAAARASGRRALFFGVERRFLGLRTDLASLLIGEQPVWDPTRWAAELARRPRLREQLRRARAKGVGVRPVCREELMGALRPSLDRLVQRWRATKTMPAMGFLVEIEVEGHAEERRFVVAERAGELVGLLALAPVYARRGWLLETLLRDPRAPSGTPELLINHALRALSDEGCKFATLGLAPLAGDVGSWLVTAARLGRSLFDFEGLRAFKARLRPASWMPLYLAYPRGQAELWPVLDSLVAFARGRPVRFALHLLLRAPPPVLQAFAVLLVPWMLAMALAPAGWFPSPTVRWAWLLFDLGMASGLRSLSRRWGFRQARLLATAATVDAALTATQLAAFNAPRLAGVFQGIIAAVALAAPAMVSVLLWASLRERGGPRC